MITFLGNLTMSTPNHTDGMNFGSFSDLGKDVAAVGILHYLEEAAAGTPPDSDTWGVCACTNSRFRPTWATDRCTSHVHGTISWWSPLGYGYRP